MNLDSQQIQENKEELSLGSLDVVDEGGAVALEPLCENWVESSWYKFFESKVCFLCFLETMSCS